jgi:hypothetical protein
VKIKCNPNHLVIICNPTVTQTTPLYCLTQITSLLCALQVHCAFVVTHRWRTSTVAIPSSRESAAVPSSRESAAGTPAKSGSGAVRRHKAVPLPAPGDRPGCQRVAGGPQRRSAVQPAQDERHPLVVRLLSYQQGASTFCRRLDYGLLHPLHYQDGLSACSCQPLYR